MKFAVSCGGTGGHMFPGLAVASVLVSRGHEVAVVLSGRKVEAERRPDDLPDGAKTLSVPVVPFSIRRPLSLFKLARSFLRARSELSSFRPDAILAMGSYTSAAPVLAARTLGIPVVLHEANAVPGAAVAFLARFASVVCTCFPGMERHFPRGTVLRDTGLPLRAGFSKGLGGSSAPQGVASILVMGGSQGARDMNRVIVAAFAAVTKSAAKPVKVVHLAGTANEDEVRSLWANAGLPANFSVEVVGFERDMARRYAEARACISRAGASSCFELALAGLPTFLVPLPGLARDHQTRNAESFAASGAAELAPQASLTGDAAERFARRVLEAAAEGSETAESMREAIGKLARPDAAARVADAVEEAAARRKASTRER